MATLSDLKEVKEALDAGLISQAEYDAVKSDYVRAKKECQKLELRTKNEAFMAKKEALEFQRKQLRAKEEALEFQKKERRAKEEALEFQKRELIAKEAFQQRKAEADLRAYALESIVKHGSSLMSEEQKADLVRDYAKMSGLDGGATVNDARASKRQRVSAEDRDAAQPQPSKPPRTSPAAAVPPPADAPAPADEDEYSNFSDGDGEDDSESDEPMPGKVDGGGRCRFGCCSQSGPKSFKHQDSWKNRAICPRASSMGKSERMG